MTITYVQALQPLWYIVGLDGLAAGGAQLFTYDSLTMMPKVAYQDAAGLVPYPNPIIFDLNGTKGPIYWKLDSANPTDLYYIEAYDSNGNLLFDEDNFPSSGSGGSTVNTFISLKNYITNNQFIDNIGDQAGPLPTNLVIAPSNHQGFTPAQTPVVGTYGVVGPDIRFVKNNTNATDNVTFPLFTLASAPLTGGVTPTNYVRYQCTNNPSGETYKSFQFPITQKVKNLSNQKMTFGIWAKVAASPIGINVYSRQYYGNGTGATAESGSTRVNINGGAITLTTTWTFYPINFTMPDVGGNSIGTPGLQTDDDAVYIQVDMPLGAACDVWFTKPALYLGTINPLLEFDSYDQINSIDSTPRVGDTKATLFANFLPGWIPMNDESIGNVGSGASNRANADTFQLYKTIWDGVSNTFAPVTSGGPSRGVSAIADFLAGRPIQLPLNLGRVIGGAGGPGAGLTFRALGEWLGEENHVLTTSELPSILTTTAATNNFGSGGVTGLTSSATPGGGTIPNGGGGNGHNTMQPSTFFNIFIKL